VEVFAGLLCVVLGCLTSLVIGLIASNVKNMAGSIVTLVIGLLVGATMIRVGVCLIAGM